MRKSIWVAAGAVGIVAAIATGGTALALAASANSATSWSDGAACGGLAPKLTVQGTGMASGTPNVLTVSVGIDVTDPSAQASLADDDSKASAVTAALKQGGVLEKDVQTTNLQIQPQYNSRGTVTGYEVTNTLTAELRDFSSAGSVIDALAEAAGNAVRINSLSFSIEDSRGIENQARTDAVHQAVSHARSMARAAGERLGPVCSLTDNSSVSYESPDDLGPLSSAASPVPVEPGTQQASAQVTMVYSLE